MTLKKTEVYAKNISEQPQTIVHPGLSQFVVVPVAPGGYTFVTNHRVTIDPGQCFRVPMQLGNQGRPICKLRWAQEISREEFETALFPPVEVAELTDAEAQKQKEAANPPAQANDATPVKAKGTGARKKAAAKKAAPVK